MARIDDYLNARKLAIQSLCKRSVGDISEKTGFGIRDAALCVPFLGRSFRVSHPDFTFADPDDPETEIKVQEQVVLLHYMQGATLSGLSGKTVAYREIRDASFYFGPFTARCIDPLKRSSAKLPKSSPRRPPSSAAPP